MKALTSKQIEVYNAIGAFLAREGMLPTYRELAKILGVSHPTVFQHVQALEKKGIMLRVPGKARAMLRVHRELPSEPIADYYRKLEAER